MFGVAMRNNGLPKPPIGCAMCMAIAIASGWPVSLFAWLAVRRGAVSTGVAITGRAITGRADLTATRNRLWVAPAALPAAVMSAVDKLRPCSPLDATRDAVDTAMAVILDCTAGLDIATLVTALGSMATRRVAEWSIRDVDAKAVDAKAVVETAEPIWMA
jgi:hypothetical protein